MLLRQLKSTHAHTQLKLNKVLNKPRCITPSRRLLRHKPCLADGVFSLNEVTGSLDEVE